MMIFNICRSLAGLTLLLAPVWPISAQLPRLPGTESQPATHQAEERQPTEESILARRQELRSALASLERPGSAPAAIEKIDRLLALQLAELRRAAERPPAAAPADLGTRFGHRPPYSVGELDALLDELDAAAATRRVAEETLLELTRIAGNARTGKADAWRAEDRQERLHPAQLEAEAAIEHLRLRRLQLANAERDLEHQRSRERALQDQVLELREQLQPKAAELEAQLARLDAEAAGLNRQLALLRERLSDVESRWSTAREQADLTAAPGTELVARSETLRLELTATEHEEELLLRRQERIELLGNAWRLRFRVLAGDTAAGELAVSAKEVARQLDSLDRERRLVEARLDERRLALKVFQDRRAGVGDGAPTRRWLEAQEGHLQRGVTLHEQELEELTSTTRLISRLHGEIQAEAGGIRPGERLAQLWQRLGGVWRFQITSADDQPITIGKIAVALLLILIGYLISKLLSRRLGRSILPRFGMAKGAVVAFETLAFYGLLAIFFLWALRLVNIPLTVFTVVGGVLAIGIGFGSQNIMNNFISGLIILAEHPIKVGDLVDVDGVFGHVERIGPRSSRIRAGDNTHVIVPNSSFLENKVLNWTVSDDLIRTWVDVGVAYGSPIEDVAAGLRRAISEEPAVLEEPKPEILFMDFGDNALAFRAYFWVRIATPTDRFRFQSKVRFRIDRVFREAGLVIAFPQRDVHLDSSSPLEIRMVGDRAD